MIVLPGIKDLVSSRTRKARGDVMILHGGRTRRLATVYGSDLPEMRRNKHAVARALAAEYEDPWYTVGAYLSLSERAAMRVLRVLGKNDFARVVSRTTISELFRKLVLDSSLDILPNPGMAAKRRVTSATKAGKRSVSR